MDVYNYFSAVRKDNDLSYSAHVSVVCFLAACHTTMLAWLKASAVVGGPELLARWHLIMERDGEQKDRKEFFRQVVKLAASVSHYHLSPSRKFMTC